MRKLIYTLTVFAFPLIAGAQGTPDLGNLQTLITSIGNLVRTATPIVVGLALLVFFWGLVKYIANADNDEKKKDGRNLMIWGIIALFVMVAVFGIIQFIGTALGINVGGDLTNVPGVTF